jgi:hypothetical protein
VKGGEEVEIRDSRRKTIVAKKAMTAWREGSSGLPKADFFSFLLLSFHMSKPRSSAQAQPHLSTIITLSLLTRAFTEETEPSTANAFFLISDETKADILFQTCWVQEFFILRVTG